MASLVGKRVLIVEDELLVAMVLEDMLKDFGADDIRIAGAIAEALTLIDETQFDLGILDLNLNGDRSTDVAEILRARNVPIVFATGYDDAADTSAIILQKPYTQSDVAAALAKVGLRLDP